MDETLIREHMPVVGSDGAHVGTVDHLQDGRIKLTKNDSPDGQHHLLAVSEVATVDDSVRLKCTAAEAHSKMSHA